MGEIVHVCSRIIWHVLDDQMQTNFPSTLLAIGQEDAQVELSNVDEEETDHGRLTKQISQA